MPSLTSLESDHPEDSEHDVLRASSDANVALCGRQAHPHRKDVPHKQSLRLLLVSIRLYYALVSAQSPRPACVCPQSPTEHPSRPVCSETSLSPRLAFPAPVFLNGPVLQIGYSCPAATSSRLMTSASCLPSRSTQTPQGPPSSTPSIVNAVPSIRRTGWSNSETRSARSSM